MISLPSENLLADSRSVENDAVNTSVSEVVASEPPSRHNTHLDADEEDLHEYDFLKDVNDHKDVYLFKVRVW